MVRYGENIKEDESIMAIVFLYPLFLWICKELFIQAKLNVTNNLGNKTPYFLGLAIYVAIISYDYFSNNIFMLTYLTVLWLTGFIDDCFGTNYPKGLKGHLRLFFKAKKISTGLLKLLCTVTIAFLIVALTEGSFLLRITIFLLLILPPHVMNLFDTRPLRVWKVIFVHIFLYFPLIFQLSFSLIFTVAIIVVSLIYFEGSRKGMLGDNGATLLGGLISVFAIYFLSFSIQWLLICFYLFIIFVTEKISISEWIERKPFLRRIDRWGVID